MNRIDQVIWREAERCYAVLTRDRGQIDFELSGDGGARDEYGARWQWRGDLAALAAQVHDGTLEFTQYPNAFERIAASFDDRVSGDIWVTSRLGYEFQVTGTKVNRRGSHGSLHIDDSTSPLVVAGCPKELLPRCVPRTVDVSPLCLSILGLPSRRHVARATHVDSVFDLPGVSLNYLFPRLSVRFRCLVWPTIPLVRPPCYLYRKTVRRKRSAR